MKKAHHHETKERLSRDNPKSFSTEKNKLQHRNSYQDGFAGCQKTMEKTSFKFWEKKVFRLATSSSKCKGQKQTFPDISDTKPEKQVQKKG